MKKIAMIGLLFASFYSMASVDYQSKYEDAQERLADLKHRLYEERTKNIELNKEYTNLQTLKKLAKKYENKAISLVSKPYQAKFTQYYDLLRTYKNEDHTFRNNKLFNQYTIINFDALKTYVSTRLTEVTIDNNNTVYINGEKLVK